MIRRLPLLLALVATAATATMKWPDLFARPKPAPDATVAYGADPLQHVEVWLPKGAGPFPTVLMVHGGCWTTGIAKADIMDWIAGDLRQRGIAVWNVEYRGVDRPGGGYPGTFLDVAAAADALRANAARFHLRTDSIVAVGHSAGGHLALWLTARPGLPRVSPLWTSHPLFIWGAISLGGLPDLKAAASPPGDTCGADVVPELTGLPSPSRPDVYADTSPASLPNPGIEIALVNGALDPIAPPAFAEAYARKMRYRRTGRPARYIVPDAGHVELITPGTSAWQKTVELIHDASTRIVVTAPRSSR